VLSGAKDRTLRLWDLSSGECRKVLEGHEDVVRAVAILPDGGWALSGGEDKTVRLWELATGRCASVERTSGSVLTLAVSGDGRRAAAGTYDRKVLAFQLERPA
jgi:WD40 repeat protein